MAKPDRQTSTIPLTTPQQIQNGGGHDDDDVSREVSSRDTQCGLGSWRPSWLQPCANVRAFTATLAFWSLFGNMNFTYYTAVITQIERDYGLSSSMSGFIKNVDNIGYMLTVVLFSHFFRYGNKPRLFAAATVLSSTAIFIFATPHFFFSSGNIPPPTGNYSVNETSKPTLTEFCASRDDEPAKNFCGGLGTAKAFNAGAFGIFILSELLQGIGQSPKFTLSMTYLDDNAKNSSPKYFGMSIYNRRLRNRTSSTRTDINKLAYYPIFNFLSGSIQCYI